MHRWCAAAARRTRVSLRSYLGRIPLSSIIVWLPNFRTFFSVCFCVIRMSVRFYIMSSTLFCVMLAFYSPSSQSSVDYWDYLTVHPFLIACRSVPGRSSSFLYLTYSRLHLFFRLRQTVSSHRHSRKINSWYCFAVLWHFNETTARGSINTAPV